MFHFQSVRSSSTKNRIQLHSLLVVVVVAGDDGDDYDDDNDDDDEAVKILHGSERPITRLSHFWKELIGVALSIIFPSSFSGQNLPAEIIMNCTITPRLVIRERSFLLVCVSIRDCRVNLIAAPSVGAWQSSYCQSDVPRTR